MALRVAVEILCYKQARDSTAKKNPDVQMLKHLGV